MRITDTEVTMFWKRKKLTVDDKREIEGYKTDELLELLAEEWDNMYREARDFMFDVLRKRLPEAHLNSKSRVQDYFFRRVPSARLFHNLTKRKYDFNDDTRNRMLRALRNHIPMIVIANLEAFDKISEKIEKDKISNEDCQSVICDVCDSEDVVFATAFYAVRRKHGPRTNFAQSAFGTLLGTAASIAFGGGLQVYRQKDEVFEYMVFNFMLCQTCLDNHPVFKSSDDESDELDKITRELRRIEKFDERDKIIRERSRIVKLLVKDGAYKISEARDNRIICY